VCAGASVSGAISATLTLTAVPIGCDGAVFSAVAANGVSPDAASNGAALTVNPTSAAPTITLQPVAVSVPTAATATFTSAASGVPSPTVQWYQSTDGGSTWALINGATSASFTTPANGLADSGKLFRAVFTNASGSVNSNAAMLTVEGPFKVPGRIAVDAAGELYVADTFNDTIREVSPGGVVTTLAGLVGIVGSADGTGGAARFDLPGGVAVDASGNVYVADGVIGHHELVVSQAVHARCRRRRPPTTDWRIRPIRRAPLEWRWFRGLPKLLGLKVTAPFSPTESPTRKSTPLAEIIMKTLVALLASTFLVGSAYAQSTVAAETAAPSRAATTSATTTASAKADVKVERQIKDLRAKLKITSAEESQWDSVAQAMRESAGELDAAIGKRQATMKTATAVEDLNSYEAIARSHADGVKRLSEAFAPLYAAMSVDQKKVADDVFAQHKHGRN
jgi:protein CpxP